MLATAMAVLALGTMAPGAQVPSRPASVAVDTSRVVDVRAWAGESKRLIEQWYPKIVALLGTPPEKPPAIRLVYGPGEGVAGTSGATIHINTDWIMRHPEDKGLVIHELVHIIQAYPRYDPSWLVEGIADYVRWWQFEQKPLGLPRSMSRSSYKEGYRIAGAFLAYTEQRHPGTVKALHAALRKASYTDSLWQELTGMALDDLWNGLAREWDSGSAFPDQGKLQR